MVKDGSFLQLAQGNTQPETRRHILKLAKICHRTTKRNNFLDARIVNYWSSLLAEVVTSSIINNFKINCGWHETDKQGGILYEH